MNAPLLAAPFALSSSGLILLNTIMLTPTADPHALVDLALGHGGPVFIALALTPEQTERLVSFISSAAPDVAALLLGFRKPPAPRPSR